MEGWGGGGGGGGDTVCKKMSRQVHNRLSCRHRHRGGVYDVTWKLGQMLTGHVHTDMSELIVGFE